MAQIHILNAETIDKIAAGEVVERPASVAKELVENAIDAGATAITVEARDGGIALIRVTDNGCGMEESQLRTAFLRHATSKIESAEDLAAVSSLGFRGEALSSIAAVSKVEVITKTAGSVTGTRILLEGAQEMEFGEVGAPDGTTFLMRNLFFNTPVRRKFLKQPATEGGYIADLMEHLALSRPDISFQLLLGGQVKFHTSGSGDLREAIYRIYGRDVAAALVPVSAKREGIRVEGYLGTPALVRSNRNFEICFINGRFIRSNVLSKAVEEGCKEHLMQHKFPLCVLHLAVDPGLVDVNVHPAKMDVRFSDAIGFCGFLTEAVRAALREREMIPEVSLSAEKKTREVRAVQPAPEPFERRRAAAYRVMEEAAYTPDTPAGSDFAQNHVWNRVKENVLSTSSSPEPTREDAFFEETSELPEDLAPENPETGAAVAAPQPAVGIQQELFGEKILAVGNRGRFRVIGQVFGTYWMVEFEDKLLLIDQHAAHEKVCYERLIRRYREREVLSQGLLPPAIVSLSGQEEAVLKAHLDVFLALGFEVEVFGGSEYALRGVPAELYGCDGREMFLEVLDSLLGGTDFGILRAIEEKIASMSCKAAVKGNQLLSAAEAEALIDELLALENPYNCPHGRPTVIAMSRTELEKKFKRIVS